VPIRSVEAARRAAGRLNVLWLLVDDLRPQLNLAYGQQETSTPALDALAAKSVIFERAYCQVSVCAPSRNSFLTGRRPDSIGVYNFVDHFRSTTPDAVSLPQWFVLHGYVTLGAGKTYQPGKPPDYDAGKSWSKEMPYLALMKNLTRCHTSLFGKPFDVCPEKAPHSEFMDSRTADYALKAMEVARRHRKNFFVAAGFYRPHLRWHVPHEFYAPYASRRLSVPKRTRRTPARMPDVAWANEGCHTLTTKNATERMMIRKPVSNAATEELRRGYYAAVSWVDFCAGRVLKGLEAGGLGRDTIILLSSDHGFHLGEQGSWTKHTLFEVGVRVPLMLHVPGLTLRLQRTQAFVELTDIYRTLADFAGLPPPANDVQGVSMRQIVQGDAAVRNYSVSQYPRCPRKPDTLWDANCKRQAARDIGMMGYSLRVRGFRFTEWYHWKADGRFGAIDTAAALVATELYALDEATASDFDSFEATNIATEDTALCVVEALRAALRLFVHVCQAADVADACHARIAHLVDIKRRCPLHARAGTALAR